MSSFDRRRFLRVVGLGGAGAALAPLSVLWSREARAAQTVPPDASPVESPDAPPIAAVVHGPSPADITTAAIAAMGGMSRFISRGDVVVVKPNIGWDRKPEQAANTNPEVVGTVIRLTLEAGAAKVLVLDNPCNDPRRCYKRSGIEDAAREAGARVSYVEKRRLVDVDFKGEVIKNWPVYREFIEADKLINVPIVKHHTLARLTLGMKNWIGAVGGRRSALHQDIDHSVVDLTAYFKPVLTVMDAVRVLTRNGPSGGNLHDVNKLDTVAAGTDPVAMDALGATLMGFEPHDLPHITIAEKRDLGYAALDELPIVRLERS